MKVKSLISISFLMAQGVMAHPVPLKRNLSLEKEVVKNYAKIAYANYRDSLAGAEILEKNLAAFTAAAENGASEADLDALFETSKLAWTYQARLPYGQSEIFRFYNGPVDFEPINDGVDTYLETISFEGVEGLMNAWPLDEAYIDYVQGDANAGIINDRSIEISREQIELLNERDGEKNISAGFHAIEFLLWGQDFNTDGPGMRPVKDFTIEKNADRRRLYLNTLGSTLVSHLKKVTDQWTPQSENFRKELEGLDTHKVLESLFVSMTSMAGDELKSERIENALLLEDQEEEHSCFSDTTVNDIYTNYLGVKNIYLGQYTAFNFAEKVNGASVSDLVAELNPALDKRIREAFLEVEKTIAPFYGVNAQNLGLGRNQIALNFDVAITSEQDSVQAMIDTLDVLDGALRDAAQELGIRL